MFNVHSPRMRWGLALILCLPLGVGAARPAKFTKSALNPPAPAGAPLARGTVSDRLEIPLRAGPGSQTKTLRMVGAGQALSILGQDPATGFTQIQLDNGSRGWLPSKFVIPSNTAGPGGSPAEPEKTPAQLQAELRRLNSDLIAVRQAAANALQIQAERDQLQASVIRLERDLESLRREKNALDGDYRQDWFFIGAGVLLGGVLLGVFLPRLSWRKKSRWDSF